MADFYPSILVVLGFAIAAIVLTWLYFRRFQVTRPPVGVFNLTDIVYMIGSIILVPYLYLLLPSWLVAGLLIIGTLSVLYFVLEPVLQSPLFVWLVSLLLLGADVSVSTIFGNASNAFLLVNNVVLLLMVVGLTNLWAQSGMKAGDVALLSAFLIFYDLIATSLLPLMTSMVMKVASLPLLPVFGWTLESRGSWVGIGLGDLLIPCVFALVMRKAFGRLAGIVAVLLAVGSISAVMLLPVAVSAMFPVMVVLCPLMLAQYVFWSRRQGSERTTWQYLRAEPL